MSYNTHSNQSFAARHGRNHGANINDTHAYHNAIKPIHEREAVLHPSSSSYGTGTTSGSSTVSNGDSRSRNLKVSAGYPTNLSSKTKIPSLSHQSQSPPSSTHNNSTSLKRNRLPSFSFAPLRIDTNHKSKSKQKQRADNPDDANIQDKEHDERDTLDSLSTTALINRLFATSKSSPRSFSSLSSSSSSKSSLRSPTHERRAAERRLPRSLPQSRKSEDQSEDRAHSDGSSSNGSIKFAKTAKASLTGHWRGRSASLPHVDVQAANQRETDPWASSSQVSNPSPRLSTRVPAVLDTLHAYAPQRSSSSLPVSPSVMSLSSASPTSSQHHHRQPHRQHHHPRGTAQSGTPTSNSTPTLPLPASSSAPSAYKYGPSSPRATSASPSPHSHSNSESRSRSHSHSQHRQPQHHYQHTHWHPTPPARDMPPKHSSSKSAAHGFAQGLSRTLSGSFVRSLGRSKSMAVKPPKPRMRVDTDVESTVNASGSEAGNVDRYGPREAEFVQSPAQYRSEQAHLHHPEHAKKEKHRNRLRRGKSFADGQLRQLANESKPKESPNRHHHQPLQTNNPHSDREKGKLRGYSSDKDGRSYTRKEEEDNNGVEHSGNGTHPNTTLKGTKLWKFVKRIGSGNGLRDRYHAQTHAHTHSHSHTHNQMGVPSVPPLPPPSPQHAHHSKSKSESASVLRSKSKSKAKMNTLPPENHLYGASRGTGSPPSITAASSSSSSKNAMYRLAAHSSVSSSSFGEEVALPLPPPLPPPLPQSLNHNTPHHPPSQSHSHSSLKGKARSNGTVPSPLTLSPTSPTSAPSVTSPPSTRSGTGTGTTPIATTPIQSTGSTFAPSSLPLVLPDSPSLSSWLSHDLSSYVDFTSLPTPPRRPKPVILTLDDDDEKSEVVETKDQVGNVPSRKLSAVGDRRSSYCSDADIQDNKSVDGVGAGGVGLDVEDESVWHNKRSSAGDGKLADDPSLEVPFLVHTVSESDLAEFRPESPLIPDFAVDDPVNLFQSSRKGKGRFLDVDEADEDDLRGRHRRSRYDERGVRRYDEEDDDEYGTGRNRASRSDFQFNIKVEVKVEMSSAPGSVDLDANKRDGDSGRESPLIPEFSVDDPVNVFPTWKEAMDRRQGKEKHRVQGQVASGSIGGLIAPQPRQPQSSSESLASRSPSRTTQVHFSNRESSSSTSAVTTTATTISSSSSSSISATRSYRGTTPSLAEADPPPYIVPLPRSLSAQAPPRPARSPARSKSAKATLGAESGGMDRL